VKKEWGFTIIPGISTGLLMAIGALACWGWAVFGAFSVYEGRDPRWSFWWLFSLWAMILWLWFTWHFHLSGLDSLA
jgi:hypothetical protein